MANHIAAKDVSNNNELNISQCNMIAKNIKNLYKQYGKAGVIRNIRDTLPNNHMANGLSMDQKDRVVDIVDGMFFWHWLPFSRVRNNMARLTAAN